MRWADVVGKPWLRTYASGKFPAEAFAPLAEARSPDIAMLDPANIGIAARDLYRRLLQPRPANVPLESDVPSSKASALR